VEYTISLMQPSWAHQESSGQIRTILLSSPEGASRRGHWPGS